MSVGLKIEPGEWYTQQGLRLFGLDGDSLDRATKAGRLRCKLVDRMPVYRGEWLLAWLDSLPEPAGGGKK